VNDQKQGFDFDWRISMASVKEDGEFSVFTGYERSIAVIGGQGMLLRVGSSPEWIQLLRSTPPLKFPGHEITEAKLIQNGAISDFNVFSKQEKFSHQLSRFFLNPNDPPQRITFSSPSLSSPSTHILCPLGGDLLIKSASHDDHLIVEDGDSCLVTQYNGDVELSCRASAPVELFLTDLYPKEK
jgi:environmental stress-induced protein Ves